MRWSRKAPLLVGLAAIAASEASQYPSSGLVVNPSTEPAYTYENDAFRCIPPSVNVNVNSTHVWLIVTSYGQTLAGETTDSGTYGRSQFAFATFLNDVAYQSSSMWDPNTVAKNPALGPAIDQAFQISASGIVSPDKDEFLFRGSCNLAEITDTRLTKAGNITLAPTSTLGGSLTTPDLVGLTREAAGCSCATYSVRNGGSIVDDNTQGMDAVNGMYPCPEVADDGSEPSTRFFYSTPSNPFNGRAAATLTGQLGITQAINTNRWSIRQTTCGGTEGDSCSTLTTPTSSHTYFTDASISAASEPMFEQTHTCSLKTESLLVLPLSQFTVQLEDNHNAIVETQNNGVKTYNWTMYTVEYASTAPANFSLGLDQFTTRVTPSRFSMTFYQSGAVVQVLAVGDVAPGLLLHTTATGSMGNIAYSQRLDANDLQMTWQMSGYVQQRNGNTGSTADTTFDETMAGMYPSLILSDSDYKSSCRMWQSIADQTPLTFNSSTYSCANANCKPLATPNLPAALVSGMSPAANSANLYWVQYLMTVTCTITYEPETTADAYEITDDFVLPPSTLRIKYRLQNSTGAEITDRATPPFSDIMAVSYTSPGLKLPSVSFPLTSSIVPLAESVIADNTNYPSLSDIIYANEGQSGVNGQVVYSQALAYRVQIADVLTRNYWQVMPALVLMVVTNASVAGGTFGSSTQVARANDPLPITWCGLDNANGAIQGVWAIADNSQTTDNSGGWLNNFVTSGSGSSATLTRLGPTYGSIANVLSTDLSNAVASLLTSNKYSNISDLQYNILKGNPTRTNFVAAVSDSTGGFALPLRNRFMVDGKPSGFQLSFCSISQAVPYLPMVVDNMYPVYTTASAAKADTMAVDGAIADPVTYVSTSKVKYYAPAKPASTGGMVCLPPGDSRQALFTQVTSFGDPTLPPCTDFINTALLQLGIPPSPAPTARRLLRDAVASASGVTIAHTFSMAAANAVPTAFQTTSQISVLPKNFVNPPTAPATSPPPPSPVVMSPPPPSPTPPPPSPPSPPMAPKPPGPNPDLTDIKKTSNLNRTLSIAAIIICSLTLAWLLIVSIHRCYKASRGETPYMGSGYSRVGREGGASFGAPKLTWAPNIRMR